MFIRNKEISNDLGTRSWRLEHRGLVPVAARVGRGAKGFTLGVSPGKMTFDATKKSRKYQPQNSGPHQT